MNKSANFQEHSFLHTTALLRRFRNHSIHSNSDKTTAKTTAMRERKKWDLEMYTLCCKIIKYKKGVKVF